MKPRQNKKQGHNQHLDFYLNALSRNKKSLELCVVRRSAKLHCIRTTKWISKWISDQQDRHSFSFHLRQLHENGELDHPKAVTVNAVIGSKFYNVLRSDQIRDTISKSLWLQVPESLGFYITTPTIRFFLITISFFHYLQDLVYFN